MAQCELYGCLYNEDGHCNYDNANLKFPCARACNEEDIVGDMEE